MPPEMGYGRRHPLAYVLAAAFAVLVVLSGGVGGAQDNFDKYFNILYGHHKVKTADGGQTMQFDMDKSTGSGFRSKVDYTSGSFEMRIKLPTVSDSKGVITTYYLTSLEKNHTEVDLEFISGKCLQTNIFIDDVGNREQRLDLWFDPSADFHSYKILWNPTFVGIYVDRIPIRAFQRKPGQAFLEKPQFLMGTLWTAPDWAGEVDWSKEPFKAFYASPFWIDGCFKGSNPDCVNHSWFGKIKGLNPKEQADYDNYKKYFTYDYCTDKNRKPPIPNECTGQAPTIKANPVTDQSKGITGKSIEVIGKPMEIAGKPIEVAGKEVADKAKEAADKAKMIPGTNKMAADKAKNVRDNAKKGRGKPKVNPNQA